MKQVLQHARTGEITVEEVPAPQLLPGCVLVRIAASVVSAGTERASAEFARKNLLQKAKSRPDLVRDVISKVQRDGLLSAIQAVRTRQPVVEDVVFGHHAALACHMANESYFQRSAVTWDAAAEKIKGS